MKTRIQGVLKHKKMKVPPLVKIFEDIEEMVEYANRNGYKVEKKEVVRFDGGAYR